MWIHNQEDLCAIASFHRPRDHALNSGKNLSNLQRCSDLQRDSQNLWGFENTDMQLKKL